jgi:uncharacterized protein (TIGR02996 family)
MSDTTQLGFKRAISENPLDSGLRLIYADCLETQGREREAGNQRWIAGGLDGNKKGGLRESICRRVRRAASARCCPVKCIPGNSPPTFVGESGYQTFKSGGRAFAPGAARAHGYRLNYIRSTRMVTVGFSWLVAQGWIK